MAALFTRKSMPPNSSTAACATSGGLRSSPMSSATAMARPCCSAISLATLSAPARLMSATTTAAPSAARRLAYPSPMPPPEPVTTATLSSNRPIDTPGARPTPVWITYTRASVLATASARSAGGALADHLALTQRGPVVVVDSELGEDLVVVLAHEGRGPVVPGLLALVPAGREPGDPHLARYGVPHRGEEAARPVLGVVDDHTGVDHRRDRDPRPPQPLHELVARFAGERRPEVPVDVVVAGASPGGVGVDGVACPCRVAERGAQRAPLDVVMHCER